MTIRSHVRLVSTVNETLQYGYGLVRCKTRTNAKKSYWVCQNLYFLNKNVLAPVLAAQLSAYMCSVVPALVKTFQSKTMRLTVSNF